VAKFRYLEKTVTNKNGIYEKINDTLNSGNVCYQSVSSLKT
jgi:hypothetical protein